MAASPSAYAAFESSGPGGKLHWSERRDGHWYADASGGHFDVVPMSRGYHVWWRPAGGRYVDLGHHGSLGGAFAAARYYLDEPAAAESGSKVAEEERGGWGVYDPERDRWLSDPLVGQVNPRPFSDTEERAARFAEQMRQLNPDRKYEVRRRPTKASEESSKACCGDANCAHRHPPEVPTTACEKREITQYYVKYKTHGDTEWKRSPSFRYRDDAKDWITENLTHKGHVSKHAHPSIHKETVALEGAKEASLAEAPPPMHVQIPPDAYAQWVAYGDAVGPVDTTEKVYRLLSPETHKYDQEIFLVVVTDLHFKLRSVTEVGRGERSMVGVGIEEVMRAALNTPGGANFLVSHGHPTGKCRPSEADKKLHRDIESASKTYASLKYLDHVVIGVGEFYSIREGKMHKVKG